MLLRYNKTVSWKIINPSENRTFFDTTRRIIKIRGILQNIMWRNSIIFSVCQCIFFSTKTHIYLNYYRLKNKKVFRLTSRTLSTWSSQLRHIPGKRNPRLYHSYTLLKKRIIALRNIFIRKAKRTPYFVSTRMVTNLFTIHRSLARSVYFINSSQKRRPKVFRKRHLTLRQQNVLKKFSLKALESKDTTRLKSVRSGMSMRRSPRFVIKPEDPKIIRNEYISKIPSFSAKIENLSIKYLVLQINESLSTYLKTPVVICANSMLSTKATQLLTAYQIQLSASLPFFMRRFFFHRDLVNIIICTTILRSSYLLSFYLARLLERIPRHKWFFHIFNRFVSVFKFYCRAPISLKILVKGRVNKKQRKHVVCVLRTQVALSKLSSAVDYSITHSFTRASVLGVKVWVISNSKTALLKTFDQKYRTY